VAVTTVPVTMLMLLLVLVCTLIAPLAGLVETTVGAPETARASADKLALVVGERALALSSLAPPPHPAISPATSNAINPAMGLNVFSDLFMSCLLSLYCKVRTIALSLRVPPLFETSRVCKDPRNWHFALYQAFALAKGRCCTQWRHQAFGLETSSAIAWF
jgi:hypothetical protein